MLRYFEELGKAKDTAEGPLPLSFTELKHWMDLMNLDLTPFEVSTIITLSRTYVSSYYKYQQDLPAPYLSESNQNNINAVGIASFKRMAKK